MLALAYSNAFLICTAITGGAIVLAALLRKPDVVSAPGPEPEPAATAPALPQPTPLTKSTPDPAADAPITEPVRVRLTGTGPISHRLWARPCSPTSPTAWEKTL